MNSFVSLALLLVGSLLVCAARAQLPADVKSDLGPGVPPLRVRPGYRLTRAVPDKKLKEARFIQFSADGKTLFLAQREQGNILALRDPDADGVFQTITTFT